MHWKTDTQGNWGTTFNQTGGSKASGDTTGTNNAGSAPAGYTAVTTSAVQYDNTSQSTGSTGIGSALLLGLELAVDATYGGGAGTASLGSLVIGYDEARCNVAFAILLGLIATLLIIAVWILF